MEHQRITHTLEPWFDAGSTVLILGTIPSPKSRAALCYYGHPQNRFWRTLAAVFQEEIPLTVPERREFVQKHRIALWDVLSSCDIRGAEDASIASPIPNDIPALLSEAPIKAIFTTGQKAKQLYDQLIYPITQREAIALPSTSPANRRWCTDEALVGAYSMIRRYT